MVESQTNVLVQAPSARQEPTTPMHGNSNMIPQMSDKGYQVVQAIIDPNAIYLDKMTAFLYGAHLTKSPIYDPESPVPGYKLTKVGGLNWKPNMNQTGYSTTVSEVLMALSEDGSVTRFPNDFKLQYYAARQTMSIVGMMIANREEWEFTNYSIIYPFGLTLWKAIVATLSRSIAEPGKTTLMDKLIHPALWWTQGEGQSQQPKNKYFNF
jgi:hypothetical protein